MSETGDLRPLLAVQKRRVEQAFSVVRARNEVVRERQRQCDAASRRLQEAIADCQVAREDLAREVREHVGREMEGGDLDLQTRRQEWRRSQVDECHEAFASTVAELTTARQAVAEAQVEYRRACAREEALQKLMNQARRLEAERRSRQEEQSIDDLLAHRYASHP